jgi:hypothetical protein
MGQRFLTHKLGEFRCKECNTLMMDKCFVCKIVLDEKECFADEENNSYCQKCIKIYQEEKKKKDLEKLKAEEEAKRIKKEKLIALKNTIHCDFCASSLFSETIDFSNEKFEFENQACILCKHHLINEACNKCNAPIKTCNLFLI